MMLRRPKRTEKYSHRLDIWECVKLGFCTKDSICERKHGCRTSIYSEINKMIDENILVVRERKIGINPQLLSWLFDFKLEFLLGLKRV